MDRKLPVAREALTRLGWNLMPHQAGITRKDHAGRQRLFVFGRDNPRVLRLWFEEAYTCQGAHASDRIRIGHHRADPSCARGLELPKPPRHAAFSFRSHRRIFFAPDSLAHNEPPSLREVVTGTLHTFANAVVAMPLKPDSVCAEARSLHEPTSPGCALS